MISILLHFRYNIRRGNIDGNNRHHVHEERSAGAVIDPAIAAEQRGIHHHSSNMQPITIVEPLIIHPGLQDPKTMEIVASQQNPPGGASKRRTRTPFTVIEVTALVQAVELLGTGRLYTLQILPNHPFYLKDHRDFKFFLVHIVQ
jgi:hypothetical protein